MELDLSTVQPSLAGPKRPQDRVELKDIKQRVLQVDGKAPLGNSGFGTKPPTRSSAGGPDASTPMGRTPSKITTAPSSSPRSPLHQHQQPRRA
jgi:hypothetical protein